MAVAEEVTDGGDSMTETTLQSTFIRPSLVGRDLNPNCVTKTLGNP